MNHVTLQTPLIVVADNTPQQIKERVGNICSLLNHDEFPAPGAFSAPGSLKTSVVEIRWDLTRDSGAYISLAHGRRTLFLLDVAWEDEPRRGIEIAQDILDSDAAEQCVLLLKSVDQPADAEEWKTTSVRLLRTLRTSNSGSAGRVRSLAANTSSRPDNNYERDIVAQALLDLQEEAIFDAIHRGAWGAPDVEKAITQISEAQFYGAFGGNRDLGTVYKRSILDRYRQQFRPSYSTGPLNIGIAQVLGQGAPYSLKSLVKYLNDERAPESAGLVSALLDYGELAAAECLLFQPTPKSEAKIKKERTELRDLILPCNAKDIQGWKPDRFAKAKLIKTRCDVTEAQKAFETVKLTIHSCKEHSLLDSQELRALSGIMEAPAKIPGILESCNVAVLAKNKALAALATPVANIVEPLFNTIIDVLTKGNPPEIDDLAQLKAAGAPEFLTLDWNIDPVGSPSRIPFENKRTRLLNRELFDHPAVEAARIIEQRREKEPSFTAIREALLTYIQSPEAIAALVDLLVNDRASFDAGLQALAATDANVHLPADFQAFDRLWRERWRNRTAPSVLADLHSVLSPDASPNGRSLAEGHPAETYTVSLLELLVAHLAILEYRLRSFCVLVGNGILVFDGKKSQQQAQADLFHNLGALWTQRRWERIFKRDDIVDQTRGAKDVLSFKGPPTWTGELLGALRTHPKGHACYDYYRHTLNDYEIRIVPQENGKPLLGYQKSPPPWILVGNLSLPPLAVVQILSPELAQLSEGAAAGKDIEGQPGESFSPDESYEEPDEKLVEAAKAGDANATLKLGKFYDELVPEIITDNWKAGLSRRSKAEVVAIAKKAAKSAVTEIEKFAGGSMNQYVIDQITMAFTG